MNQKIVSLSTSEKIKVEWMSDWSNMSIHKDGMLIGSVKEKADLKVGRTFMLPDGRKMMAVLTNHGLEVWCDGTELMSGMKTGTVDGFGRAYKALLFMGWFHAFFAILALIGFVLNNASVQNFFIFASFASVWIGLGFWAKHSGNKGPLWIGVGFCVMYILFGLNFHWFSLLLPGIVLYYVYPGTKYEPIQSAPILTTYQGANAPLDSDL